MKRINITEVDSTNNNYDVSTILQDRVFIPGFAVNSESEDYIKVPVDCDTLEEFYAIFRGVPFSPAGSNEIYYYDPVFKENQPYPAYNVSGSTSGFANIAIPTQTGDGENDTVYMFQVGTLDPSWAYAIELLGAGMPITYMRMNEKKYTYTVEGGEVVKEWDTDYDVTVVAAYNYLTTHVYTFMVDDEVVPTYTSPLLSPDDVNVKFLTSGGYPVWEYYISGIPNKIAIDMANIAKYRGDCVALIDHTNKPERELTGNNSVFKSLNDSFTAQTNPFPAAAASFAAMFTPWVKTSSQAVRPASMVYLEQFTSQSLYTKNWLAVAGVNRGKTTMVSSLLTNKPLTNAIAEYYQRTADDTQDVSMNPITYIKPNGYCIWGNRTLTKTSTTLTQGYATSFLNLRNLVSDVKKQARYAAKQCLFESNNDILWVNFKSFLTPLLDSMVSGNILKGYKIIKGTTGDKQKVVADIRIYPVYAVESFDITITVTDDDEVTTAE